MKRKVIIDQGNATTIKLLQGESQPQICIRQVINLEGSNVVSKINLSEAVLQEFIRQCTEVLIEMQFSSDSQVSNYKSQNTHLSSAVAEPIIIETEQQAKTYCISEIRKKFPRAYMAWLQEEDDELIYLRQCGTTVKEIAVHLGRQKGAIYRRIKKLALANVENVA